jgi:hypothetical protein
MRFVPSCLQNKYMAYIKSRKGRSRYAGAEPQDEIFRGNVPSGDPNENGGTVADPAVS